MYVLIYIHFSFLFKLIRVLYMLNDLTILNGDMSLKFDSLNTIYTITLNNNDNKLSFDYKINDGDKLSVFGNDLEEGLNEVVLTVYNDKEQMSYYLYVLKKETELANKTIDEVQELNISKTEGLFPYAAPLVGSSCFLFILLFFTLLFKKN